MIGWLHPLSGTLLGSSKHRWFRKRERKPTKRMWAYEIKFRKFPKMMKAASRITAKNKASAN